MNMQTITLEPLRWQTDPARITVQSDGAPPAVYYQVTQPTSAVAICCGRPVEELPRMLTMLAPSHHLAAALALDRLFQVDPPELAQNMRRALLQAQYCSAHLRKIFFLLTSRQDPFADFHDVGRGPSRRRTSSRLLGQLAHHAALAQEAEDILGGRHDHPLTAVAGGVSRFLKEDHYARLADIAEALLAFARQLAEFMRGEMTAAQGLLAPWGNVDIPALAGLHLGAGDQPTLGDPAGGAARPLSPEQMGEIIALQQEAWTYQPFAFLKEKGWQGVDGGEGLFFVGPLARFNAGLPAATPLAEEERQALIECLGAPPVYRLAAAFGAITVELIQAAETLRDLGGVEKLGGPTLRTIPAGLGQGRSTWAVLEAPEGLIWHQYQVDEAGMVQSVAVIDARAANNAIKCRLTRQIVGAALARKEDPAAIRENVAVALLPF
jgi:coenzyme F420-reducing hydrogenase alpha subunit